MQSPLTTQEPTVGVASASADTACPGKTPPVFARMAELVQTIGKAEGWLEAYEGDFYDHDRLYLSWTAAAGAEYLWIVRQTGTHLIRIGIDPAEDEAVSAALDMTPVLAAYHIILDAGLDADPRRITPVRARELCESPVRGRWRLGRAPDTRTVGVTAPGKGSAPIAWLQRCEVRYERTGVYVDIDVTTSAACDRALVTALWIVVRGEVTRRGGSLFARPGEVTLNGESFRDRLTDVCATPPRRGRETPK